MNVEITFQANDDDYIDACSPQVVISSMKRAMDGDIPYHAHMWFGRVSHESPLLSFACFPGVGVYISFNLRGQIWIYVDSDDFSASYSIHWGQDHVVVPRAYIMPRTTAERIIGYFCNTGGIDDDAHWRNYESLDWDLYTE